jgi:hypothetical protein
MSGKTKSLQPGGAKDLRKENTHCPNIQATLADSQGKAPARWMVKSHAGWAGVGATSAFARDTHRNSATRFDGRTAQRNGGRPTISRTAAELSR